MTIKVRSKDQTHTHTHTQQINVWQDILLGIAFKLLPFVLVSCPAFAPPHYLSCFINCLPVLLCSIKLGAASLSVCLSSVVSSLLGSCRSHVFCGPRNVTIKILGFLWPVCCCQFQHCCMLRGRRAIQMNFVALLIALNCARKTTEFYTLFCF